MTELRSKFVRRFGQTINTNGLGLCGKPIRSPILTGSISTISWIEWICKVVGSAATADQPHIGHGNFSARCCRESTRLVQMRRNNRDRSAPYYDNICYADLSDFFYVWQRRALREVWPDLFRRVLTPKDEELVATPYRHGGKDAAERFFMEGMAKGAAQHAQVERRRPPRHDLLRLQAIEKLQRKG